MSRGAPQENVVVTIEPLWICAHVVNDASSTVKMPTTGQRPISDSGGSDDCGARTARA